MDEDEVVDIPHDELVVHEDEEMENHTAHEMEVMVQLILEDEDEVHQDLTQHHDMIDEAE